MIQWPMPKILEDFRSLVQSFILHLKYKINIPNCAIFQQSNNFQQQFLSAVVVRFTETLFLSSFIYFPLPKITKVEFISIF